MRVLMVVAMLYMPIVTIAYGFAWLLLPEAADGRIYAEETLERRFDAAVIGGMFMVLIGLSSTLSSIRIVNGVGLGWFQPPALAIVMTAIVVIIVSTARSVSQGGPYRHGAVSPYGAPQHGTPQYGNPQYDTHQQQAPTVGASVPFGRSAPDVKDTGSTTLQQQSAQALEGFPAYGVLVGSAVSAGIPRPDGATSTAQGMSTGPRPVTTRLTQPHAGWATPPSVPRPHQWALRSMPTHRPRTVSSRANLIITGLLILVVVAVLAGIYVVSKGSAIPFIAAQTVEQTITRVISIDGGVRLIIVGLSLAIVALRDRSAGQFTTLSITGLIFMTPTAVIDTEGAQRANQHTNMTVGNTGKQTMSDWRVDKVSEGNPMRSIALGLTSASAGTPKMIMADWQAWSRLATQMAGGQPVQIVRQSNIGTPSTNMEGNDWAASLNNCFGVAVISPTWGKLSFGGITVLITDEADIDTLTIVQSLDSSGIWGSASAPTSSVTPSAMPTLSITLIDPQPGN